MIAYKAFNKDLTCTSGGNSFQYYEGIVNRCEAANCRENGFHCAENPLDCLSYYPNMDESAYYRVRVGGDINEDGTDSKISCTELTLLKKLDVEDFVRASVMFVLAHPKREISHRIEHEKAVVNNKFAIVYGLSPIAKGSKIGDILGFIGFNGNGTIVGVSTIRIDGKDFMPNVWYNIDCEEVKLDE